MAGVDKMLQLDSCSACSSSALLGNTVTLSTGCTLLCIRVESFSKHSRFLACPKCKAQDYHL